jgi:apolipoprotein N-acyltransferase
VAASALALHLCARIEPPRHLLLFVALVPWLAALDRARSARAALASALAMSVAFALAVFSWFAPAVADYSGAPRAAGAAVLLLLAPLLEPQLFVFALVRRAAGPAGARGLPAARRALAAACAWVGAEWALPKLFGDTLGHGLHASAWLRQAADLAGAPGLTLALLLANEAALSAARAALRGAGSLRARLRAALVPAAGVAAIAAALAGYGAWRLGSLAREGPPPTLLRAALVQANVTGYARLREELGSYEAVRLILDEHFALSAEALAQGGVDLVLWPETVYPTTFGAPKSADGADFDRAIAGFAAASGVPLVFGSYDADGGAEYNSAFFLAADGAFEVYRKAALFPLSERVPGWLESARLRRWLPWLGTWRPGAGPRVRALPLADGRRLLAAPLICYDAVDPRFARAGVRAGAELLVTLSNDAWFASGEGPRLHLVVSAFRSIETRRPQLRVTNSGISAVIDAAGELRGELGVGERGVLLARLPAGPGGETLALRWGDWLGPAALPLAAALLAFSLRSAPGGCAPRPPRAARRRSRAPARG